MHIISTMAFSSPICCSAGDILYVIWQDSEHEVASIETKILDDQTLDIAVLVEYTPEESREMGLELALGMFAGQSKEMV